VPWISSSQHQLSHHRLVVQAAYHPLPFRRSKEPYPALILHHYYYFLTRSPNLLLRCELGRYAPHSQLLGHEMAPIWDIRIYHSKDKSLNS
jgi:hypothetical protein